MVIADIALMGPEAAYSEYSWSVFINPTTRKMLMEIFQNPIQAV